MHTITLDWIDTAPPPRPAIRTYFLRARDYGDGYTLRALIADAEQHGDTWLAFTIATSANPLYVVPETTVFARGRNCTYLDVTPQGSIFFGRDYPDDGGVKSAQMPW